MSVDWLDIATVVAAIALTWAPGYVVARCAGLRGLYAVAVAPALTLGAVAIATLALQAIGVRWNVLWLAGTAAVLAGMGYLLWRWRRHRGVGDDDGAPLWSVRARWILLGVGVVAAVAGVWVYASVSRGMSVIPQDFDHVFQANAIRYIANSGNPSPEGLRAINDYENSGAYYYPSAWHALAALVLPVAGGDILRAEHSMIMMWFLALPLGIASVAKAVRLPALGAGVAIALSTCMADLPWELLWRGVLPFAATLAFLLPVIVLGVEGARRRSATWGLLAGLGAFGLVSVHTSAAMTIAVFAGPALIWVVVKARGVRWRTVAWMAAVGVALVILLIPAVLIMRQVLGGAAVSWPAVASLRGSVVRALTFVGGYRGVQLANLGLIVVPGMALAFRRRYQWAGMLALSTLYTMGLFVLAAGVGNGNALSAFLTQWWWSDQLRVGALTAVAAPVFAGIAAQEVLGLSKWAAERWHLVGRPRSWMLAAPIVATCVIVGAIGVESLADGRQYTADTYTDGPVVTHQEAAAYAYLATLHPTGRVMNDTGDGSAWMYALDNVTPVYGQFAVAGNSPEQGLLWHDFNELATNADVRAAAQDMGIEYVFVGDRENPAGRATGLRGLDKQPDVFQKVYQNDDATIYKIVLNGYVPSK